MLVRPPLPRHGTQLFAVARSPGAVQCVNSDGGGVISRAGRAEQVFGHRGAAVVLSYTTSVHGSATDAEGGHREKSPKGWTIRFFQYNNNVVRYFFPLPKRVSFTLPRARAAICFLARLIHTHVFSFFFFFLSDDHIHFPPVVQCRKSSPKSRRFEVLGPSSAPNDLQPMMYIIQYCA